MSTLNEKQQAVLRKAAAAIKDRGHEGDARLADSVLGVIQALAATQAPSAPMPMSEHNARFAIDGAIQYGREDRNKPPSDDHWLMEYWLIGQQLRELGKTGWDNRTPLDPAERVVAAPSAPVAPDERAAFEAWAVTDKGGWTMVALKRNSEVREYENVGDYSDDDVHSQWEAWQARAAMSAQAERRVTPRMVSDQAAMLGELDSAGAGIAAARERVGLQAAPAPDAAAIPECWCATCRPVTMQDCRMVLCPTCGNKRCPRATDHRLDCSGSNEPGQVGSAYSDGWKLPGETPP